MNTPLQLIDYTNSPEVVQAATLAEQSYGVALAIKIDSREMYEIAGAELCDLVTRRKYIEAKLRSLTDPLTQVINDIRHLFRAPTERLEQAEQLLRKGVLSYQQAEREKAEKLRREAEAKQAAERAQAERAQREAERAEREALEAAAHATSEAERIAATQAAAQAAAAREEAQAQVEIAEIAPMPIIAEAPKAEGVSTRLTYKAEVTDFRALVLAAAERAQRGDETLLAFLTIDTKALAGAARSMRNKLSIPGVRVYAEESLSVRRAG